MRSVSRRISDGRMLRLLVMWLEAPVEETDAKGDRHRTTRNKDEGRGSPQGSPISPLLSNIYMRRFVKGWKTGGHERHQCMPRAVQVRSQHRRSTRRVTA